MVILPFLNNSWQWYCICGAQTILWRTSMYVVMVQKPVFLRHHYDSYSYYVTVDVFLSSKLLRTKMVDVRGAWSMAWCTLIPCLNRPSQKTSRKFEMQWTVVLSETGLAVLAAFFGTKCSTSVFCVKTKGHSPQTKRFSTCAVSSSPYATNTLDQDRSLSMSKARKENVSQH